MPKPILARALVVLSALFGLVATAGAQDYPSKPITLVVPSAPGGGAAFVAQILSTELEKQLGQPVVTDFRPGGGTVVATQSVAQAPGDGYTILLTTTSFTVNNALVANLPYDVTKDFTPITLLVDAPLVMVVNADAGVNSVKELAEKAKAAPGTVTYGSAGIGSSHHLLAVKFAQESGIEVRHVPYQGGGPAATAVASGEVTFAFVDAGAVKELVAGGLVKALAVSAPTRLPTAPDIPTMEEAGYPGFVVTTWQGLVAPKGLPEDVLTKLNTAVTNILKTQSVADTLINTGKVPRPMTSAEYGAFIAKDVDNWVQLAAEAGITAQ